MRTGHGLSGWWVGKFVGKKPSAPLLFLFVAVCLFVISQRPVSKRSGSRWIEELQWLQPPQHLIARAPRKRPKSLGSPGHPLPSRAASLQPRSRHMWPRAGAAPGSQTKSRRSLAAPAAISLLHRRLRGQTDGGGWVCGGHREGHQPGGVIPSCRFANTI